MEVRLRMPSARRKRVVRFMPLYVRLLLNNLDRRSLTFHLHCSFSCFEPIFNAVRAAKLVSETRQNDIYSAGIQERILDIFFTNNR